MPGQREKISDDDANRARDGLTFLLTSISGLFQLLDELPTASSQAEAERGTFTEPDLITHAITCGCLSIASVMDHSSAFFRSSQSPATLFAPWTCARAVLESATIAMWLLDPRIDARVRVGRHLSFRYEGFVQQKKYDLPTLAPDLAASIENRIEALEAKADHLGFTQLRKNEKRTGVAQHYPTMTDLCQTMLGAKLQYKLLCAIAHSQPWALQQVGFHIREQTTGDRPRLLPLVEPKPATLAWTCQIVAQWSTQAIWFQWRYLGGNLQRLERAFEDGFDAMRLDQQSRFWRR